MRSLFLALFFPIHTFASVLQSDSTDILLSNVQIQIEATQAINDMYNFRFDSAELQFRIIRTRYPDHPLPYYLLGLSEWWKIMPNLNDTSHDEAFFSFMDQSLERAEVLHEDPTTQLEGSFFLAAIYGMRGRLESDRGNWLKAANAGRLALKYQRESVNMYDLSPEFMFGDALYNYYSVWIRENYPLLKPIMIPFPKGDKQLGIDQLRKVATQAFYTRTEAQLYLMRILALDENDVMGALQIAEYLNETYPNNPYFQRYYARLLYQSGQRRKMEEVCLSILNRLDEGWPGYEANSGRYAGFFLGQYYELLGLDEQAKKYYLLAVKYAEEIEMYESGYYLFSLLHLGKMEEYDDHYDAALGYYEKVTEHGSKKSNVYKESKQSIKRVKKIKKSNS